MKNLSIIVLISTMSLLLLVGCASMKDAREAKGQGEVKIYDVPLESAWAAAVEVINDLELELVSEDREKGLIQAQRPISAFSWGEHIALFLEGSNGSTQVEIVNKKSNAANITAKNWTPKIFAGLDEKLGPGI